MNKDKVINVDKFDKFLNQKQNHKNGVKDNKKDKDVTSYYSLHNHTFGSDPRFGDASMTPRQAIYACLALGGIQGINFTDHETLLAHRPAYSIISRLKDEFKDDPRIQNFRVTFGDEIYLVDRPKIKQGLKQVKEHEYCIHHFIGRYNSSKKHSYVTMPYIPFPHFTLTARNAHGYSFLEKLCTKAWKDSFYYGYNQQHVQLRLPTYKDWVAKEMKNYKGDVIASTACLGSELSQDIMAIHYKKLGNHFGTEAQRKASARVAKADIPTFLKFLTRTFGKNNVYFELMPSTSIQQKLVNHELWELSKKTGIRTVISTDSHFINNKDEHLHEQFLHDESPKRKVSDFYHYAHLYSFNQLKKFFSKTVLQTSAKNSLKLLHSIKPIKFYADFGKNKHDTDRTPEEDKVYKKVNAMAIKVSKKHLDDCLKFNEASLANIKDLSHISSNALSKTSIEALHKNLVHDNKQFKEYKLQLDMF